MCPVSFFAIFHFVIEKIKKKKIKKLNHLNWLFIQSVCEFEQSQPFDAHKFGKKNCRQDFRFPFAKSFLFIFFQESITDSLHLILCLFFMDLIKCTVHLALNEKKKKCFFFSQIRNLEVRLCYLAVITVHSNHESIQWSCSTF